ncbi:hypothetical protein [Stieleria varia]|uniref:Thioredoxin domain-containing protein n=1 Tax=Stieleria varia TaxID=2528005 RepID=A0A5C6AFM7_9BACT|nr:hypothetical protein [Stieleria varia]TWT98419.1 hypothetical protein Pla52n_49320 [Stieleria varia]
MKNPIVMTLSALAFLVACTFSGTATAEKAAEQLQSGPKVGDSIGAFYVTKLCGAEEDGVSEGKNLCYRCKNASRPQVMVFTRSADPQVAKLVQELDKAIAKNEDAQLRAFVNFMGDSKEDVSDTAKKFASESKVKNIPFVLPNEFENGPDDYGINAKAEVTIVMANKSKVEATYAVAKADQLDVDAVVANLKKILE